MQGASGQLGVWVLGTAFLLAGPVVSADQIRVNGIPVPDVEVLAIRDGALVYLTPSGVELSTPLDQVQSVWLDDYPAYRQALEKLAADEPGDAVPLLLRVLQRAPAREAWVKQLAAHRLVEAYDAAGRGVEAAGAFADLVELGPAPFLLSTPPTRSVGSLTGDARARAAARLEQALRRADDDARSVLRALLDRLRGDAATPVQPSDPPQHGAAPPAPKPASTVTADGGPPTAASVVLPASIARSDDPVVVSLRGGRFAEALEKVDRQMAQDRGRLQQRLYLRAVALLGLADTSGERDDYLDAGIAFMRAVTAAGPGSSFLGPALLEAAYVHQRIDAPEIAAELLEEAGLLLDEEDEPRYYQRYQTLRGR